MLIMIRRASYDEWAVAELPPVERRIVLERDRS